MNGSLSGSLTVFPNSIQFACDPGFLLNGSSVRTCQANGTWDGLKTICSGTFGSFWGPLMSITLMVQIWVHLVNVVTKWEFNRRERNRNEEVFLYVLTYSAILSIITSFSSNRLWICANSTKWQRTWRNDDLSKHATILLSWGFRPSWNKPQEVSSKRKMEWNWCCL